MTSQKVWSAILILSLAVLINIAGSVMSQDGGDAEEPMAGQPGPEEMQEMMEKWMATTNPGEEHEALAYFHGDWTTSAKVFWGPEPAVTTGTSSCSPILGGRFNFDNYTGAMLMPDMETGEMAEVAYTGIGIIGYDKFRKMYTMVWMDSMSTSTFKSTGSRLEDGSFDFYGQMDEPMLDVIGRTVRSNISIVNENQYVFSMYDLHAGPDYKVMEITYTRVVEEDDSDD